MKLILNNIEVHDVQSLNLDNDEFRVTLMQDTGKGHFEGCALVNVKWASSANKILNPILVSAYNDNDDEVDLENWSELKSQIESILLGSETFIEYAEIELATW